MARDLYAILGVSRSASEEEIRRTYRKLARRWHPDVNPGKKEAEQRFKEISAAYEVLSAPAKRKAYDEFGEAALKGGFDPEQARAYQQWQSGRGAAGSPFAGEAFDFDLGDLFGDVLGGHRARPHAGQGQDIALSVEIDFAQAVRGSQVELRVPTPVACSACKGSGDQPGTSPKTCANCGGTGSQRAARGPLRIMVTCANCSGTGTIRTRCASCHGRGQVPGERNVSVNIPAGVEDGATLRIPRAGAPGADGRQPGDLLLETHVKPHPYFRRDGLDLYLRLPVSLDEALNGGRIEVPTSKGTAVVKVPPHTQSGTRLRLRGQGIGARGGQGDLFVEIEIQLPDRKDARLAEAARAARELYSRPLREGVRL